MRRDISHIGRAIGGRFNGRFRGRPAGGGMRLRWSMLAPLLGLISMGDAAVRPVAAASTGILATEIGAAEMPPAERPAIQPAAAANTAAQVESWIDVSAQPQLYVTGMVGSSLTGHGSGVDGGIPGRGLLAGGMPAGEGAIGVAIPRPGGGLRLEFEARGGDEWSTMGNIWRDISVTERFGTYLGGGMGAGGGTAPVASPPTAARLDGHVGAGMTYAVNERVTFDVGYRFHAGRLAAAQDAASGGRLDAGAAVIAGSEVLFSVRLYDPFRGWLK